ncbi:MAG TPA: TIGR00268 family protein, partial [Candidatus Dormibacteraeota bacterium]
CLSSRIPHGTQVTVAALRQIEAAERALKDIGFRQVRVRHHGDVARIEVEAAEIARLVDERDRVVELLRATGYKFVSVDLEGYSTGSLNRVWKAGQ